MYLVQGPVRRCSTPRLPPPVYLPPGDSTGVVSLCARDRDSLPQTIVRIFRNSNRRQIGRREVEGDDLPELRVIFTAGVGTLFALPAMLVMLPALVASLERWGWLRHEDTAAARTTGGEPPSLTSSSSPPPSLGERGLPRIASRLHRPRERTVVRILLGVTGIGILAAGSQLSAVEFEYDCGELEPRYEAYEAFKDKTRDLYSTSSTRNAAYVLTDQPTHAEAAAQILRERAARDTTSPTIRAVETIYDRFPVTSEARRAKLARIQDVRDLLDDRFLRASDDADLDRLGRAASTREPLSLAEVPTFLKAPFLNRDGTVGDIVIVYPSVGLSDGRQSMAFADDVSQVELPDGTTYHAASTSIVASDMLRLMIEEAPLMIVLTISLILVFKIIALRSLRWVAFALAPLATSFLWMFGWMGALGLKLSFFNLVVLPTVLGIGDDSGIHLVHRYREEGPGSVRKVLTSTGEHVTMSAITTMVGFGGLLLSMHPGLRSIGALAVLGSGCRFSRRWSASRPCSG